MVWGSRSLCKMHVRRAYLQMASPSPTRVSLDQGLPAPLPQPQARCVPGDGRGRLGGVDMIAEMSYAQLRR